MAPDARPHGPASAPAMVESGFPGEARLVRHHGRNTSRRDRFARPGELDPGWTPTVVGGTLREHTQRTREVRSPPGPLCGRLLDHRHIEGTPSRSGPTSRDSLLEGTRARALARENPDHAC